MIKGFEGLRLDAYPDPGTGNLPITIGYGSTTNPQGDPWQMGDRITAEQADRLLRRDVAQFETAVKQAVQIPVNSNQFSALVSFAFNVGSTALRESTLLRLLNAGNFQGAADQFLRWNKGSNGQVMEGLKRRRAAERQLFLN